MLKSVPDAKLSQYQQWAAIAAAIADQAQSGVLKGKLPLDRKTLKNISDWASIASMLLGLAAASRGAVYTQIGGE